MPKSKIEYLDTLRAIATIAVILVHTSTPVVKMVYGVNMQHWWVGNIFDSIVRFCVPAFLMLSGATMLGKTYVLSEFYQKRLMRVFLPFCFWLVAYLVFTWATLPAKTQPHRFENISAWAWKLFVDKGVSTHFWYIYMILVLYAFVPFLSKFVQQENIADYSFGLVSR